MSDITDFESTLSFKTGLTTWSYVWTPPTCTDGRTILVQYESFASLSERQLAAVKLVVTSDWGLDDVRIVNALDGQSALRTKTVKTWADRASHQILSSVSPVGIDDLDVVSYVLAATHRENLIPEEDTDEYVSDFIFQFAFDSAIGAQCSANPFQPEPVSASMIQRYRLQPGLKSATVCKYVGVASSEHFGLNAEALVSDVVKSAVDRGYDTLREEHSAQVRRLMHADFVADFRDPVTGSLRADDDIVKALQITVISSAYYLYTSLVPYDANRDEDPSTCIACNSLSVGGLVSQTYGGKIFWDADLFVAPAIQGVHPRLARQFSLYRINRAEQSRKNTGRHGLKPGSMLYAWTSGRYGQCYNISAPCVMYQYHLNTDIAMSLTMGRNTSGDHDWFDQHGAADVVDGVATGLGEILTRREDSGLWGIDVMTDADEYYMFVADGSFTATAVSTVLEFAAELRQKRGIHVEADWLDKIEHMAIPTSEDGVVLEFGGMQNDVFPKQADVILAHFPYDYKRNFSLEKHQAVMDYYSVRTDPHGPAMTWSLYAIAANSLATSGCAFWTYLVKSFQPYIRGPFFQFSEQQDDSPNVLDPLTGNPINTAFPFLTGHGGLLQVLTAGFLGLRVTHRNLIINPSLPLQLAHYKPPIQFYNGAVVAFRMNHTHTTITRLDASRFDGLVPDQYGQNAMPITIGRGVDDVDAQTIHLYINKTAVVENRQYDMQLTVPGNILQCQSTKSTRGRSTDTSDRGDLPFAATDGYGGSFWQPETSSLIASLVVEIAPSQLSRPLHAIYIDFAMRPPKFARVWVSNSSDFEPGTMLTVEAINITQPWDPDSPVVKYVGNVTTLQLTDVVWSGKYAKLEIAGCWVDDGAGATVAEFALLARNESATTK